MATATTTSDGFLVLSDEHGSEELPWRADSVIGIREVTTRKGVAFEVYDETTGAGQWRRPTRAAALESVAEELSKAEPHGVRRGASA